MFVLSSYADEFDDKVKQLQRLQTELENAENKAKQTATRKQQTDSEIQRTASLKRRTDENLRELRVVERVRLDSLKSVEEKLQSVEERIADLNYLQNVELDILLRADRSYRSANLQHRDQRYLALMAGQSRDKLNILTGYQISLSQDRELKNREYGRVATAARQEAESSRKYERQVKNLQSESQKLTQEQQKLQDQISKLRQDAAQLEALIAQLAAQTGKEPASYKFTGKKISWPLKGKIIRAFGEETRAYGTSVVNNGIDIAAPEWSNVVAADDGTVVFSGSYGGQGKLIIIDHNNGFFTVYAYNNELLAGRDAKVKKGQIIAKSGMTGSATQPSLHFELRRDGKAINPLPYLE
jgi:murein DD-endopeptidase MepM/ murein hydrolase activator NlpD